MKIWKIATVVALATVAAALFTASAYAYMGGQGMMGNYGASTNVAGNNVYYSRGMMGSGGMMGGYLGMMRGYAYDSYSTTADQTKTNITGSGCGNHTPYGYNEQGTAIPSPINITTAKMIVQNYLTGLNNPDLTIAQVEEYTQNFYVQIREKSSAFGAFELTIDKYIGILYPEMGPNMMWNTKYGSTTTAGMMGGMMNGYTPNAGTTTAAMPVNVTQAKTTAQQFLNVYYPGTTVGDVTTFYGYYTIEVLNSAGTTYGLLSVNGYTGQVWFHTWHGTFV